MPQSVTKIRNRMHAAGLCVHAMQTSALVTRNRHITHATLLPARACSSREVIIISYLVPAPCWNVTNKMEIHRGPTCAFNFTEDDVGSVVQCSAIQSLMKHQKDAMIVS